MILSTRKLEYDAESSDDAVKSLMQAQHRAVLKDLKRGQFDSKIDEYLGSHPDLQPPSDKDIDVATPPIGMASANQAMLETPPAIGANEVSAAFQAIRRPAETGPASRHGVNSPFRNPRRSPTPIPQAPPPKPSATRPAQATQTRRDRTQPGVGRGGTPVQPSPPPITRASSRAVGRPVASRNEPKQRPSGAGKVLISQPPIVVSNRTARPTSASSGTQRPSATTQRRPVPPPIPASAGRRPAGTSTPRRPPVRTVREDSSDGFLDQNLISEKSLDEVILAYLSEDHSDE
ncbi:MAG: hypothetical protein AAGC55_07065 [Myxococcota bacterium]